MVRGRRVRAPKVGEEVSYASPKRKDSKMENGIEEKNSNNTIPSPPTTRSKLCNMSKEPGSNGIKSSKDSQITSYFQVVSPVNGVHKDIKPVALNGNLQQFYDGTRIEDRDYSEKNGFHTFGMDRYMGFEEIKNIIHRDDSEDCKKDILNNIFKKECVHKVEVVNGSASEEDKNVEDDHALNVRLSPRKHASTLQRCVTVKENVKTPHRIRLCESVAAPANSLQQLSLKPYRKKTRRRLNKNPSTDSIQSDDSPADIPDTVASPAVPFHCALPSHLNASLHLTCSTPQSNTIVNGFKKEPQPIALTNGHQTDSKDLDVKVNGFKEKKNGLVVSDKIKSEPCCEDKGNQDARQTKGPVKLMVAGQQQQRKDQVESHKLTEYFPVRRSVRKTKKEVQEERQRTIEAAILEAREDGLEVATFDGKGRGVIAARAFRRGEFVVEYAGELVSLAEARKREGRYAQDTTTGCYMYYFRHNNQHYCIDATAESGRMGRLVNHSRNGNLVTKALELQRRPRLVLLAAQDIAPGEEITYDYGDRSREALLAHPWLAL